MRKIFWRNIVLVILCIIVLCGCGSETINYEEENWSYLDDTTAYTVDNFPYKLDQTKWIELYEEACESSLSECEYMSVESKGLFSDKEYFKMSLYEEEYLYYGDMKKNKPNGKGVLFTEKNRAYEVCYIGEFKDGMYDGEGIKFEPFNRGLCTVKYEGEFKEGTYDGKGVAYATPYDSISIDNADSLGENMIDEERVDVALKYMVVEINGTFKNGLVEGDDCRVYSHDYGTLIYEGEMKEGYRNGKGTYYYDETGNVWYDGEFKKGKYHGKGTLYDENGNVKFEGKFKNGEYQ